MNVEKQHSKDNYKITVGMEVVAAAATAAVNVRNEENITKSFTAKRLTPQMTENVRLRSDQNYSSVNFEIYIKFFLPSFTLCFAFHHLSLRFFIFSVVPFFHFLSCPFSVPQLHLFRFFAPFLSCTFSGFAPFLSCTFSGFAPFPVFCTFPQLHLFWFLHLFRFLHLSSVAPFPFFNCTFSVF